VDLVAGLEQADVERLADLVAGDVVDPELADVADPRQALQLALAGLGELARGPRPDLHSGVAVALGGTEEGHRIRFHGQHRDRHDRAVLGEHLCHPALAAEHADSHHILISMSTPAARLSRIRASTVFDEGSRMSISRLWVRISNCSRLSLSMNGERIT